MRQSYHDAAKRRRLERIVSPQTCFCGLGRRCPPEPMVTVWNFHTQQPSPGAGHNPRVMAGAWARAGQGSSCRALCRCCGSAGLTPELSRPARCGPVAPETAKRARLERIVSRHCGGGEDGPRHDIFTPSITKNASVNAKPRLLASFS